MKLLQLASNLSLPVSAVTDTWAWFGMRGTGKTYGAGVAVETIFNAGYQVVVVDPVGVWYGLRLAANGRGRGLDIPVFGGLHADVPLEPTGGELVAKIVVEQRTSMVLDVSMMTLGQQHRFVLAFATALFNLQKSSRKPVFVLFDEAHEFMPQSPGPQEAEMLSAVRRLWKMGRNFGIGVGLVSPRPAEVNKGVVNLTERMFCGRLKGPHDRKAMEAWSVAQDAEESILDELPNLPNGELVFWGEAEMPRRVRFFSKKTFDASKTPERGDARQAAALPKIDLEAVRAAMAATIEEAKMNDPRSLRARIAELERAAHLVPAPAPMKPQKTKTVNVPIFREADLKRIEKLAANLGRGIDSAEAARGALVTALERSAAGQQQLVDAVKDLAGVARRAMEPRAEIQQITVPIKVTAPAFTPKVKSDPPPRRPPTPRPTVAATGPYSVTKSARAVLTALAQHPDGLGRRKLGILAGYSPSGTSMREALALCRKEDLTVDKLPWVADDGDRIVITGEGAAALGDYTPLPTGPALRDYWFGELPMSAARIFRALCVAYPNGLTKEEISEATASDGRGTTYAAGGTSMREALAMLRGLEIVDDVGGRILASGDLF